MNTIFKQTLAVSALSFCLFSGASVHTASAEVLNVHQAAVSSVTLNDKATPFEKWRQTMMERRKKFVENMRERREKRMKLFQSRKAAKTPSKPKAKQVQVTQVKPKGKYGNLIAKYAQTHGVPYSLANAVVRVESSYRANVTGAAGEIGLMQIKLSTARGMGYKGSRSQLYNPGTNLYWGMKYLGRAHQLSGGTTCGTILKYNAGHGAKRMNPISANYCKKVRRFMT